MPFALSPDQCRRDNLYASAEDLRPRATRLQRRAIGHQGWHPHRGAGGTILGAPFPDLANGETASPPGPEPRTASLQRVERLPPGKTSSPGAAPIHRVPSPASDVNTISNPASGECNGPQQKVEACISHTPVARIIARAAKTDRHRSATNSHSSRFAEFAKAFVHSRHDTPESLKRGNPIHDSFIRKHEGIGFEKVFASGSSVGVLEHGDGVSDIVKLRASIVKK